MADELSTTLKSRTFVGLILAQFTNAFNDQATHIIGNFFVCDMLVRYARLPGVEVGFLIPLVTFSFLTPLLLFSPMAGVLADKYSKRDIIFRVKIGEVLFMAIGLAALLLPHVAAWTGSSGHGFGVASAVLMILVVFLMGVQTAFIVPCKYGIMPEILHPSVLSRANGVLEGSTFVAHLGGTAFGGYLYAMLNDPGDVANGFRSSNIWIASVVLLTLASIGAVGASVMNRIAPASPDRPLTFNWLSPLQQSFAILRRSRPLALAVLGIAFASFLTLYCRQTLLLRGETIKDRQAALYLTELPKDTASLSASLGGSNATPARESGSRAAASDQHATVRILGLYRVHVSEEQKAELDVATLIAMVGLGIGFGSLLAGHWSGSKLELGLVPIGASALVVITALLAKLIDHPAIMYPSLVLVGVSAGLYVVPMYTMLQHRAPKESKGNIVAASNFLNVVGGVLAMMVFYAVEGISNSVLTSGVTYAQAVNDPSLREQFLADADARLWIPKFLFLGASGMTVVMLILICRQLPDFYTRALLWLFSQRHYHLRVEGMHNLPQDGPVILATNCAKFEAGVHVLTATDRFVHIYLDEDPREDAATAFLRFLARLTSASHIPAAGASDDAVESAMATLRAGDMVGLPLDSRNGTLDDERFYERVQAKAQVEVIPVLCMVQRKTKAKDPGGAHGRKATVVFGAPLPASATVEEVQEAILALAGYAPDSFLTMHP